LGGIYGAFFEEGSMRPGELGELYERYGYYVQQRCMKLLAHAADAEDATQEVFMRVQRYQASIRQPVTLAWLYTIATRCCFDRMDKRAREPALDSDELRLLDRRAEGVPQDAENRAVIAGVLQRLDAKARRIAILHHVEGFSQDEVAAATGCSRKTVGKKLACFADILSQAWTRSQAWKGAGQP
jgi:RNA polymerase sigma-70 factor (ECF subfamily)